MSTAKRAASAYGVFKGDESLTVSSTAASLTVPTGALSALITNGSNEIRVRWGTPTSSVGHALNPNSVMEVFNSMDTVELIATGSDSTIFVTYFG